MKKNTIYYEVLIVLVFTNLTKLQSTIKLKKTVLYDLRVSTIRLRMLRIDFMYFTQFTFSQTEKFTNLQRHPFQSGCHCLSNWHK